MNYRRGLLLLAVGLVASTTPLTADDHSHGLRPRARLLASGLEGGSGSTVGPDGALYVTEGAAGKVSRVNPRNGRVTTFASGLPKSIVGIGGAMDVAFVGYTAYVLVTLVGPDVGGGSVVGIYRVDGPRRFTIIADIGAFTVSNPPDTDFFVPSGVQYALEPYRGGFLVTDGHHNRVYYVTLGGDVSVRIAFDNIVPTGLARLGSLVLMAQAGPVPHDPEDGRIVAFGPRAEGAIEVASGAPLLVDVEVADDHTPYALAQGDFQDGSPDGSPALQNTGSLVRATRAGNFETVVDELNQPTSLEFIGDDAYVVTLGGEIWRIAGVLRERERD
jgi:hypothetical protein